MVCGARLQADPAPDSNPGAGAPAQPHPELSDTVPPAAADATGAPRSQAADPVRSDATDTMRPMRSDATEVIAAPLSPGADGDEVAAGEAPEGDDAIDLQTCLVCGAPNSPRRFLCGRCGADLASGAPGAEPASEPVADTAAATPTPRRRGTRADRGSRPSRRWLMVTLVVVASLAVGVSLGLLVAFESGPFASDEADVPPPPAFDADVYDAPPAEVRAATVAASSVHSPTGERRYAPELMVDDDLTTAWNSGTQEPGGVGEVIEVEFAEPVWLEQLVVANGDQSSDAAFLGNARLRHATLLLDGEQQFELMFLDERGRQAIGFDPPRLSSVVRLEVAAVYPGDTYDDLAVAELGFRGWVARGEDLIIGEERASGS